MTVVDDAPRDLFDLLDPMDRPLDDPATVPSDGLTLDTPLGPVDLVAVERALTGRPTNLTPAEHAHLARIRADRYRRKA